MVYWISRRGSASKVQLRLIKEGRIDLTHPVILKVDFFSIKKKKKWLQIHGEIGSMRCFQTVAMQKSEPGWVRPCVCQAHRSSR